MSMRNLATQMGCDVSNLYNYMDSKSSLLETFLFNISRKFHEGIDEIIASNLSSEEKIKTLLQMHINITSERPYEVALVLNEWRNLPDGPRAEYIALRTLFEHKVQGILQEGVEREEFRRLNVEIVAGAILGAVRWLYSNYTDEAAATNPLDLHQEMSTFVLSGLIKSQ